MSSKDLYRVYFAHPISGGNFESIQKYFSMIEERFEGKCQIVRPMIEKDFVRPDLKDRAESMKIGATNYSIAQRDYLLVRSCDVIMADLSDATRPSIGTMCEIAWAFPDKHIIVAMDREGHHKHGLLRGCFTVEFPYQEGYDNQEEAFRYLESFLKTRV